KLAEPALRRQLADLAARAQFDYTIAVLPITVAALATTGWTARHLRLPTQPERIVLPGLCLGDLGPLEQAFPGAVIERGPQDLRDLPEHFGTAAADRPGYGQHDLQILAEINHAPRLAWPAILDEAQRFRAAGADVIDLGCDPGPAWPGVGETVR